MLFALLTAHVVTDFVLQPDWMAAAKKRHGWALLLHAAITGLGSLAVAWLYWPQLWGPSFVLAVTHLAVDWAKLRVDERLKRGALEKFLADQLAHILFIAGVPMAFGLMKDNTLAGFLQATLKDRNPILVCVFAYSMSVFFGYVLLKILCPDPSAADSKASGRPPKTLSEIPVADAWREACVGGWHWDASLRGFRTSSKYIGMLERGLITTCAALGQFLPIAIIVAPRALLRNSRSQDATARWRLGLETLVNIVLATSTGLLLRALV